jgi:hypothetical protein
MTIKYVITMPCIEGINYIQGKRQQKAKVGRCKLRDVSNGQKGLVHRFLHYNIEHVDPFNQVVIWVHNTF